jgi:hypothetical protein
MRNIPEGNNMRNIRVGNNMKNIPVGNNMRNIRVGNIMRNIPVESLTLLLKILNIWGYNYVYSVERQLTFQKNMFPPSSG